MNRIEILEKYPALYLPTSVVDNTYVVDNLSNLKLCVGHEIIVYGQVSKVKTERARSRICFHIYLIKDDESTVSFSLFGDEINNDDAIDGNYYYIKGEIQFSRDRLSIYKARVINSEDVNKVLPVYEGINRRIKKVAVNELMKSKNKDESFYSDSVKFLNDELVKQFNERTEEILNSLNLVDEYSISNILKKCHRPTSINEFYSARCALKRLNTLMLAGEIISKRSTSITKTNKTLKVREHDLLKHVPFTLTGEQHYVVSEIIDKICNSGNCLDGVLIGDVGTGKTVVVGLVARQVLLSNTNSKVVFLAPNISLAEQLCNEVSQINPEIKSAVITGERRNYFDNETRLFFGTTALINQSLGHIDLLIVDEQQQLSTMQRRSIQATHYLESSATPIPRTLALTKFKSDSVFYLKHQHLPKKIHTRVLGKEHGEELMRSIKETLSYGCKILIVCPKRDSNGDGKRMVDSESLAYSLNNHFPNLVRVYHSSLDQNECSRVLEEFKTNIPILVSTSKIQVGLTIPNLRHCIVYGAERFGLTTLHQIRGRLARTPPESGVNWGKFDLFLPYPPSESTLNRLNVLTDSNDGFYISEKDLELRGAGDLSELGKTQHGETISLIKNIEVEIDKLGAAIDYLSNKLDGVKALA